MNEADTKDEYIDIREAMWPFLNFNSRQGCQIYLKGRAG